jgi:hypothetical protein
MKKIIHIIIFLLVCNSINAQVVPLSSPIYNTDDDSVFTEIGTSFYSYLGSNAINNKFASTLIKSGFITDDLKNSNHLKRKNILGTDVFSDIYVTNMPDSMWGLSNFGYRIGLAHKQFRSVNFSDDLYNLIFYGNKQYAGDFANFDNTKFRSIDYQKLELGIIKNYNDNETKVSIYFGFNILKGQQLQALNIYKGSFYTADDGSYLDLNTKLAYYTSNQSHKQITDFNGIGLSCDAYFSVEDVSSKLTFTFASEDLGYISWKNKSYHTFVDSTIHFDGIEINNILNVAQENLQGMSKDSLMNIMYNNNDTTPFQFTIPEKLTLEIKKEWNGFINSTIIGMSYIFDTGQPIPQFYSVQTAKITKWLNVGLIENYGGFSGFNAGLALRIQTNKKLSATISSGDLTGFIMPKEAYARSIMMAISYKF